MKKGTKQPKGVKGKKRSPTKPVAKAAQASRTRRPAAKRAELALPPGAGALERKEAAHFVKTLEANKQLSRGRGALPAGATHKIETDASGAEHLVRKRYSAI